MANENYQQAIGRAALSEGKRAQQNTQERLDHIVDKAIEDRGRGYYLRSGDLDFQSCFLGASMGALAVVVIGVLSHFI